MADWVSRSYFADNFENNERRNLADSDEDFTDRGLSALRRLALQPMLRIQERKMFFSSKPTLFVLLTIFIATCVVGESFAQYGSRTQAMRQAQLRGNRVAQNTQSNRDVQRRNRNTAPARTAAAAQGSNTRMLGSQAMNSTVPAGPIIGSSAPIVGGPSASYGGGQVISDGQIIGGGSPIVSDAYFEGDYVEGGVIDEGYSDGGCGGGCGVGGSYFGGCGPCGNRNGGCGPEYWQNCWIRGLGALFSNAELVGGAQGFRSRNFTAGNQIVDDSSFGFYGGLNLGVPMCALTCGLFSGQIGLRSVQSRFEGDVFSPDNRDQLFVTAGIFRRVDYGLQIGFVGDWMHEEWFVETDLAQVRGDIGWVYPGGNTLGFRFGLGTEDDITNGVINGTPFNNLFADVIDNYRFYYRFMGRNSGHCDAYAGWTDAEQAVLGLDFDMPVTGFMAVQSGFNYFLSDTNNDTAQINPQDAWNVYVGISLRPQGPAWYGNYDRPLFNVADNGSFVFGRN